MTATSRVAYEFGRFRLEPEEARLTREDEPIRLPPKALELLIALVKRSPRLVTKEELLAEVWQGTFVEEGNLAVNVNTLRKAFGDEGQAYVETVPKKGYRFVAEVRQVVDESAVEPPRVAPAGAFSDATAPPKPPDSSRLSGPPRTRRLRLIAGAVVVVGFVGGATYLVRRAVTPNQSITSLVVTAFGSIDPAEAQEHLERGMAEALITRLASLKHLKIPPTAAVRSGEDPFEAGRRLGVDAVLTGSVQRSGERLRVTAQLSRTSDRGQIWAARFDERFTNVFEVQDTIAERIAGSLLRDVSPRERSALRRRETQNVDAYDLYLKAREHSHRRTVDSIRTAIQMYEDAIRLDPGFALAYAGLADAYTVTASGLPPKTRYPLAKAAAERAVALGPRLPEAHVALAYVTYKSDWNWRRAQEEFTRALALDPDCSLAHHQFGEFHRKLGTWDLAIADFRRAHALDPYFLHSRLDLASTLLIVGQLSEARAVIEGGLKQDANSWEMYQGLGEVFRAEHRAAESIEAFLKSRLLAGQPAVELERMRDAFRTGGESGYLRKEIEVLLSRLDRKVNQAPWDVATSLAYNFALLHDREQTWHWLEVATERREEAPLGLHYPFYDFMRDDPRFKALFKRVFGDADSWSRRDGVSASPAGS